MQFSHSFRQVESAELGHDHVSHQNVNRSGMVLCDFKCLKTILCLQYFVTLGFKRFTQHASDGRLIFRQEDCFRASRYRTELLGMLPWAYDLLHDWKVNSERSAPAGLAFHVNR